MLGSDKLEIIRGSALDIPISPAEGLFTPLEMMPRCFAVPPTAGSGPNIIPAGFDPLRQRLRGECPARFRVATAGISNGAHPNTT